MSPSRRRAALRHDLELAAGGQGRQTQIGWAGPPSYTISAPPNPDDLVGPTSMGPHSIASIKDLADHTSELFRWRLLGVAERLGAEADHLAAVMRSETGNTDPFSASVRNPSGGATGLIQFMPSTATRLGTTTAELASMRAEDQLAWVERYFAPFAGKMRTPTDVYMAVFMPAFVGRSPGFVIGRKDDDTPVAGSLTLAQVYKFNPGFDRNHDGEITVGEVGATVEGILSGAQARPRIPVDDPEASSPARVAIATTLLGAAAFATLAIAGYALRGDIMRLGSTASRVVGRAVRAARRRIR